jgi:hypothetical protein
LSLLAGQTLFTARRGTDYVPPARAEFLDAAHYGAKSWFSPGFLCDFVCYLFYFLVFVGSPVLSYFSIFLFCFSLSFLGFSSFLNPNNS